MKTMLARTAYGKVRKAGVRHTRTINTRRKVQQPCIGVHSLPHIEAIRAERESEPAAGYARKNDPIVLATPNARSSWFESIEYSNFKAIDLTMETARMYAKRPHHKAGCIRSMSSSRSNSGGAFGVGRPAGTTPTRRRGEPIPPTISSGSVAARSAATTRRSSCSGRIDGRAVALIGHLR